MNAPANASRFKLEPWKQGDLVAELPLNFIKRSLQVWNEILAEKVVVGDTHHIQTLLITGFRKYLRCGSLLSGFESVSGPMPRIRRCLHLQIAFQPAHSFV